MKKISLLLYLLISLFLITGCAGKVSRNQLVGLWRSYGEYGSKTIYFLDVPNQATAQKLRLVIYKEIDGTYRKMLDGLYDLDIKNDEIILTNSLAEDNYKLTGEVEDISSHVIELTDVRWDDESSYTKLDFIRDEDSRDLSELIEKEINEINNW